MKLPHGRRAHEDARPAWRPRSAWLWMLAFRCQHQEIATVLSDLDATERRTLKVHAKAAVKQLGSDKAPVRSGGLHALERLAQDNPAGRQAIVNVICTYLRTPFSPTAPASKPEPEATEGQKEPRTESETGTSGIDGTWQQERQVRLTAQRILADHLRDDRAKDQQSTDPPSSHFWNNIRLDLTGATLIDFNLLNGVTAYANFHRATFSGGAMFGGATFSGGAMFGGATFSRGAMFGGATFSGDALFSEATFTGDGGFREATFTGDAGFRKATFTGDAGFRKATFTGDASFGEATFTGDAEFGEAAFTGNAWFDKATFSRGASFDKATFSGGAWFGEAAFTGDAEFGRAAFTGDAWFGEATFTGDAEFGEATFSGNAWFDKATFSRGTSFAEAAFAGAAEFGEATFSGSAWFGEATFSSGADALLFEQARILSPGASHVWPTGWRLADANGGGYTVVRANDDGGS